MSFHTENELNHFRFQGAYIGEIQLLPGSFHMILDNVTILPENTTNRDIREMRCNNLELSFPDCQLLELVEEGYNIYNANGDLTGRIEDQIIAPTSYNEVLLKLSETESLIYSIEKNGMNYVIEIDGEDHTYTLMLSGSTDTEDWDRYLNLESM